MSDYLMVLGTALAALSVVVAVVQLLRLEPPRIAAILFVAGIAAMIAAAWMDPTAFRVQDIPAAFYRLKAQI